MSLLTRYDVSHNLCSDTSLVPPIKTKRKNMYIERCTSVPAYTGGWVNFLFFSTFVSHSNSLEIIKKWSCFHDELFVIEMKIELKKKKWAVRTEIVKVQMSGRNFLEHSRVTLYIDDIPVQTVPTVIYNDTSLTFYLSSQNISPIYSAFLILSTDDTVSYF